jgi:hypothetical protein
MKELLTEDLFPKLEGASSAFSVATEAMSRHSTGVLMTGFCRL